MNDSVDDENVLTREDIERSGVDVSITDIFRKPVTRIVLDAENKEKEHATLFGEAEKDAENISVKGSFDVEDIYTEEAMFLEIEFLDSEEKYYIELDDDTIWNLYQHFGTLDRDELLHSRSVLDHVKDNAIILNRSQHAELSDEKPSIPDQSELDIDIDLTDYERPVTNYEDIVHDAALSQNTPFSVIVEDIEEDTDPATVVVRHGELLYKFEYPCNSEIQDCNTTFKRLISDIGKGEPAAVEGSTLQIKHQDSLGPEQPVYGRLNEGEYVLTRPLTTDKNIFNTVSSLLSKGKIVYRGNN